MNKNYGEKTENRDPDEPERRAVIEKSQMVPSFFFLALGPSHNKYRTTLHE